jgi:hypothetical protein
MWYTEFNGTFFITIAGIVAGVVGVLVRACIKSKCSRVACLGFSCVRDVKVEEQEHEFDTTHPVVSGPVEGSLRPPSSVETEP